MRTKAERVSALFGDDGQCWTTDYGMSLDKMAACMGGKLNQRPDGHYRYTFPDDSAIVIHGEGWDIEGDEPFSWEN